MARDTFFLLIAIALAVPLSVVANLLTPSLRDWWSHRSKDRLQSRISELERDLKSAVPPLQEMFLEIIRDLAWGLLFLGVLMALSAIIPLVFTYEELQGIRHNIPGIVFVGILYVLILNQFIGAASAAKRYLRRLPNSHVQNKIRTRIERLKKVLEKK